MKAFSVILILWSAQVAGQPVITSNQVDIGFVVVELQMEVDGTIIKDVPGLVSHGGTIYSCEIPVLDYIGTGERKVFKVRWCGASDPDNLEPCSDWGSWAAEHGGGKSAEFHRSPPFALDGLKIR